MVNRRLLRFEERLGARHVELSHDLLTPIVAKSRSKRLAEAEREARLQREAEFRAKLRRTRLQALGGAAAFIMLLGAIFFYYVGKVRPYYAYYGNFSKKFGVICPFNRLSSSAVRHRAWTLRVTSEGRSGPILTQVYQNSPNKGFKMVKTSLFTNSSS